MTADYEILLGDSLEMLRTLPDASVQCCVTSPPYWGLRDYGVPGQFGLEPTPDEFVAKMVAVFREVWRVLRDDGTLWVNLGDSYTSGGRLYRDGDDKLGARAMDFRPSTPNGLKPKDLVGIPWRVAFALQTDGWYLRSDIIWSKPNCMPESATDRPTKAHEYLFLLSKSARYYYDADAIREPMVGGFTSTGVGFGHGYDKIQKPRARARGNAKTFRGGGTYTQGRSFDNSEGAERESHGNVPNESGTRNKRSVWTVATQPYKESNHFATFPPKLIEPCILAGSRPGDIVLDPFSGSGTTGVVSLNHGRKYIGIELNPEYVVLSHKRIGCEAGQRPLFPAGGAHVDQVVA